MTRYVVSLCDRTGNAVRPWIEAGYMAVTVDMQPARQEPGRFHIIADVMALGDEFAVQFQPALVLAFPPCTNLAVSGARWFREEGLAGLVDGLRLVERCRAICEASGAPWALENPVSTISTYWRRPDLQFDPYEFAGYAPDPDSDAYTKRTCLWVGGGFRLPSKRPVDPIMGSKMHLLPPSDDRADLRSETPMGFAHAVFAANAIPARQEAAE
jgi:hypothetical protein